MKIALIGPPQSGKSTLFGAVAEFEPDPALAHEPHNAVVKIPDQRLDRLAQLHRPKKVTPATIEVWDFPGITSVDEHGRQQYRKHIPDIRICDVLLAVVRDFGNDAVPAHRKRIDPNADLNELSDDFIFADLETVSNRLEKLEKSLKKPTGSHDLEKKQQALLLRCREALEEIKPLSTVLEHEDEAALLRSFAFLTEKPVVVVVNVSEDRAAAEPGVSWEHAHSVLNICADAESQIAQLAPEDRAAFLEDLGLHVPARERLIHNCYTAAGLISFLTTGPEEVRAWPLKRGATAVEAAGKIHSDIARGFIRAETVAYQDFIECGEDMKQVKSAGKLRQEGKSYTVQDGDIIHFKFNV